MLFLCTIVKAEKKVKRRKNVITYRVVIVVNSSKSSLETLQRCIKVR
jgi:hypothetical protein